jgi:hypothetical protein
MKNKIITLLLATTFILVAVLVLVAQGGNGNDVISNKQITESIESFTKLINNDNANSFGLKNAEELKALKGGKQYKKYMIELNDIKKFKPADNVDGITKELPSVEVTLVDGAGQIRTSIEYVKNKDKWEASGFGMSREIIALQGAQKQIDSVKDGRLISIPALQTHFYAVTTGTGTNFIPLEDNATLGFRKGLAIPSAEALTKLIALANEYNGLPF